MDRLKARIFRHVKGMLLKTDKQIYKQVFGSASDNVIVYVLPRENRLTYSLCGVSAQLLQHDQQNTRPHSRQWCCTHTHAHLANRNLYFSGSV